jgi:outer membrane protein assembly factor BamE (lipoprotein component of BamABCDE complex)
MKESSMRVHRSLGVAILLVCLAACGSRLNQENFDKIHEGMSQKEVREILGEPVDASGASILGVSGGEAVWKDDKTTITVHFLNDQVVSKRMAKTEKKGSSQKGED